MPLVLGMTIGFASYVRFEGFILLNAPLRYLGWHRSTPLAIPSLSFFLIKLSIQPSVIFAVILLLHTIPMSTINEIYHFLLLYSWPHAIHLGYYHTIPEALVFSVSFLCCKYCGMGCFMLPAVCFYSVACDIF